MPATRIQTVTRRRQVYLFKSGGWHLMGERDYLYPVTAVEFVRAWPVLLQKRLQSSIPRP